MGNEGEKPTATPPPIPKADTPAPQPPAPEQPKRKAWWQRTDVTLAIAAVLLVIGFGFVHIVHGGGQGYGMCWKDGWGLSDTFVDVDDYIGHNRLEMMDKLKVMRALERCGRITIGPRDK